MFLAGRVPKHVAIIMDGNGRWAQMRGLSRIEGHKRGAERAKEIIKAGTEVGLHTLTLYAFSIENWQRSYDEISMLMKLLEFYLKNELSALLREGIVFKAIGETWRLPENIRALLKEAEADSFSNKGMNLVLALSYSGRNEILRAVKKIISSGMGVEEITEERFDSFLDTFGMPAPDLIIRSSGEKRLSNFFLWEAAYSELYFTETLWPDFSREEFFLALQDYHIRERRFGTVPARAAL